MISLLINTINRYENLDKILETQSRYNIIDEILVFNNGKQEIKSYNKVHVIQATYDVGLRSRWILGALAKNDCLFVQDDDLLVPESIFKMLHGHFLFDSSRLYGIFGREIDFTHSYDVNKLIYGEVDLVLTRLACFPKMLIPHILEAEERIIPHRYPESKAFPHDDILLSFSCLSVFNKKPIAQRYIGIDSVENLSTEGGQLHTTKAFMDNRKDIIKKCRQVLNYGSTIHDFTIPTTAEGSDEVILPPI